MEKENVAIYGAGNYGDIVYRALRKRGIKPIYFVDKYTFLTEKHGIPIYRVENAPDKENTYLYISIIDSIDHLMLEAGFKHVKSFHKILQEYSDILHDYKNILFKGEANLINQEKCAWLNSILEDDESKKVLKKILKYRMDKTNTYFPEPDGCKNYLPNDFDAYEGIEELRYADCGGYVGDTVSDLLEANVRPIKWIVSFEPDSSNLDFFKKQKFPNNLNLFIYPAGVADFNGFVGFNSHGSSSKITTNDGNKISVVTLDTVFAHNPPNFIKMDIEGAETAAINGGRKIIANYKPNLAISVYHKPRDLWEIPELIYSIQKDYKFYLRLHGLGGLELILYCIKK